MLWNLILFHYLPTLFREILQILTKNYKWWWWAFGWKACVFLLLVFVVSWVIKHIPCSCSMLCFVLKESYIHTQSKTLESFHLPSTVYCSGNLASIYVLRTRASHLDLNSNFVMLLICLVRFKLYINSVFDQFTNFKMDLSSGCLWLHVPDLCKLGLFCFSHNVPRASMEQSFKIWTS